ncbi:unnamed protein product [Blepharisma stoltei]|uniref:non-specific serine/threonine protein kinase n=1 Tax=Blepharisma stoltei TaxID=1481888 RepID=A0AAU9J1D2_9CILI|nr:unnamed protein product [Blepharisma stoltei]
MGKCFSKSRKEPIDKISKQQPPTSDTLIDKMTHRGSTVPIIYDNIQKYYDLQVSIGSGRFGNVKKALSKDKKVEQEFAIKSIPKSKVIGDLEVLLRELAYLMIVDHPNIIRLYEVYEDSKYIHLVLELCTGGELFTQLLEKGKYAESEAARIIYSILHALSHLHSLGIVHRDIKPENILFSTPDSDAEIKLIDFGLSAKYNKEKTLMHTSVGTVYYIAPEVLKNNYKESCDVWSLGVIMYMLLTGNLPFQGVSDNEIISNILSCSYPNEGNPEWDSLSEDARDLIAKLLNPNFEERISACDALDHPWLIKRNQKDVKMIESKVFDRLQKQTSTNQLVRESTKFMVKYVKEKKIRKLNHVYRGLDKDHSGFISVAELKEGLEKAGIFKDHSEVENIIRNLAYSEEERLDYTDFISATLDKKDLYNKDILWIVFKQLDVDNSGDISLDNLKEVCSRRGKKVSKNEFKEILKQYGLEEKEGINYEDFCRIFEGSSDVDKLSHRISEE